MTRVPAVRAKNIKNAAADKVIFRGNKRGE